MKTFSLVLLLMASLAFVLVGCSENTAPILAPGPQINDPDQVAGLAKGAVLASASGSAQMFLNADGWPTEERSDVLRVCTFNAREYADGSCSGEVISQGLPGKGYEFKGEILQVKVEGNKAKLVFKILSAGGDTDYMNGLNCCYVVVDNGEGAEASLPDMNSPYFEFNPKDTEQFLSMSPDDFLAFLQSQGWPGLVPINLGNVQVRGNSYE